MWEGKTRPRGGFWLCGVSLRLFRKRAVDINTRSEGRSPIRMDFGSSFGPRQIVPGAGAQLPVVATFGRWLLDCGDKLSTHSLTEKDMFLWLSVAGFVIVNVHVLAIAHCCFRDCHHVCNCSREVFWTIAIVN